jgi:two-component system, OmpR family, response regulator VanR
MARKHHARQWQCCDTAVRLLLVEDDTQLADAIARGLRRETFAVDLAPDGEIALEKLAAVDYDLVVLDRDLPGVSGDAVCERLIAGGSTARILMLTASADVSQRVEGLLMGADDYLPKPFAMTELVARLRALSRRAPHAFPTVLRWNDLWLDPARRTAGRAGRDLGLTNREFAVLETFMTAEGRLVSAETLMERVWDDRLDPFSNAVRVTILTLRRKLGDPPVIVTVPGAGYRLDGASIRASQPEADPSRPVVTTATTTS